MEFMPHFSQGRYMYEGASHLHQHSAIMSHSAEQDSRSRAASPRANQAVGDIQRKVSELEEAILQHPSLRTQYKVVRTYLVLDSWVLEPISFLRQDGLWAADMAPMNDTSMKLPKPEQVDDLADLHASLFQSPPTDLFNMICKYRRYSDFKDTGIIQRLEKLKQSWLPAKAVQAENSRTAPEGQRYKCPSVKCRRDFRKAGHAVNHMENHHPEYLQLHPDYQPHHFTIEVGDSRSTSPEMDRQALRRLDETRENRHTQRMQHRLPGTLGRERVPHPPISVYLDALSTNY